jgi:hypothetical protein
MENTVSKRVDDAREWTAPELEKVTIAELTAHLNPLHPMNEDGTPS